MVLAKLELSKGLKGLPLTHLPFLWHLDFSKAEIEFRNRSGVSIFSFILAKW
jgi:hypothetical protein